MQPGANFRVTDKNVEQLVVVKDAALPATSLFGELSANDRYSRIAVVDHGNLNPAQSICEATEIDAIPSPPGGLRPHHARRLRQ
jgi:hypothetical protein